MTPRQYMRNFFNREAADRLPCIEWATWWKLTLERWRAEGLDSKVGGRGLTQEFGLDYTPQIVISNGLVDAPKQKEHGYINDEKDYDRVLPFLYKKEIIYNMKEYLENLNGEVGKNGDILWFSLRGFFWFPRELFGIEDHLYSFYDYPELYHRICRDMLEYYLFVVDELAKYISPQFMTFLEDMSYNLGPMLSEDLFREFIEPYYKKLIPVLQKNGVKVIVDSDGDITKMVPWMINSGVDGILPLERQAGVDVVKLTAEYPDFFFIGGFDKMIMKHGEDAMVKEFERIYPAMLKGNYLPSVDHQTPPDVSMENYRVYTKLLKRYCEKAKAP